MDKMYRLEYRSLHTNFKSHQDIATEAAAIGKSRLKLMSLRKKVAYKAAKAGKWRAKRMNRHPFYDKDKLWVLFGCKLALRLIKIPRQVRKRGRTRRRRRVRLLVQQQRNVIREARYNRAVSPPTEPGEYYE